MSLRVHILSMVLILDEERIISTLWIFLVDFLLFHFCLIYDLCMLLFHRNGIFSGSQGNAIKVGPVPTIQIQPR